MYLEPKRGYDIIGDIHGCAQSLIKLLICLGYQKKAGVWQHPNRVALFLGDIIDRGKRVREALHIVHDMVEAGHARCIMGNHEYYALAWSTALSDGQERFVLAHSERNLRNMEETLSQFAHYKEDWQDFLKWFYQLPLFLDMGYFRLVHACWDNDLIQAFKKTHHDGCLTPVFLKESAQANSFAYQLCNHLLRGIQIPLPDGYELMCKDGYVRKMFRAKFWAKNPQTVSDVIFQPDTLPEELMAHSLTTAQQHLCSMHTAYAPLLFIGHYWCSGTPLPIEQNLACVDYSAVRGGKLTAYRLDDETKMEKNKFFWIDMQSS